MALQKDCIHEKFSVMKELASNDPKCKKKEVSFQQVSHCSNIREYLIINISLNFIKFVSFIITFCNLKEVKTCLADSEDIYSYFFAK